MQLLHKLCVWVVSMTMCVFFLESWAHKELLDLFPEDKEENIPPDSPTYMDFQNHTGQESRKLLTRWLTLVNYSNIWYDPDFGRVSTQLTSSQVKTLLWKFFPLFFTSFFLLFFHLSPTPISSIIFHHTLPICLCLVQLWRQADTARPPSPV